MRRCIAAGLLLLAACGGGSDKSADPSAEGGTTTPTVPEGFADAPAVAAALGCSDTYVVDDPSDDIDIGVSLGDVSSGTCDVSGNAVTISVYENREYAAQASRVAETIGCDFAKSFGIERFVFASGPTWDVTPDDNLDDELAQSLADTLGGEVQSIDCT